MDSNIVTSFEIEDNRQAKRNFNSYNNDNEYKYLRFGIKGFFLFCISIGLYLGKLYTVYLKIFQSHKITNINLFFIKFII